MRTVELKNLLAEYDQALREVPAYVRPSFLLNPREREDGDVVWLALEEIKVWKGREARCNYDRYELLEKNRSNDDPLFFERQRREAIRESDEKSADRASIYLNACLMRTRGSLFPDLIHIQRLSDEELLPTGGDGVEPDVKRRVA